jgi:hypothetical protein
MLTDPKLRSQVDALWDKFWTGGLANSQDTFAGVMATEGSVESLPLASPPALVCGASVARGLRAGADWGVHAAGVGSSLSRPGGVV